MLSAISFLFTPTVSKSVLYKVIEQLKDIVVRMRSDGDDVGIEVGFDEDGAADG
jgi:hypothetical protein